MLRVFPHFCLETGKTNDYINNIWLQKTQDVKDIEVTYLSQKAGGKCYLEQNLGTEIKQ